MKTERQVRTCGWWNTSGPLTPTGTWGGGNVRISQSKSLLFLLFLKYLSKSDLQDFQGFSTLAQWAGTLISGTRQVKRKVPAQWT